MIPRIRNTDGLRDGSAVTPPLLSRISGGIRSRKTAAVLALLYMLLYVSEARTQPEYTIYYQHGPSLSIYGIPDLSDEPTLITSDVSQIVAFSNSGRYAAYYDAEGVWISRTETWSPERVISILPHEAFAPTWTPDDTRLILRLAFWPDDADPAEQPLAYNLLTESAEPWIWNECEQIAQHISTRDFALICEADADTPMTQIDTIALEWGGEFREYDRDQYEILRDGLEDNFPRPFDWSATERGQNMVYTRYTPDYRLEIISRWNDGGEVEISDSVRSIEEWFAVSHDRSMVAYTVFCGNPSDSCLEIADLNTGETIWHYEDTVRIAQPYDIAWYPDNQRVAILGANYVDNQWPDFIQVFNIETGNSMRFDAENTTGVIVIH